MHGRPRSAAACPPFLSLGIHNELRGSGTSTGSLFHNLNHNPNFDAHVKSQKAPVIVIPAKAGIQGSRLSGLDSRVCGSDGLGDFLRVHQVRSRRKILGTSPLCVKGKSDRWLRFLSDSIGDETPPLLDQQPLIHYTHSLSWNEGIRMDSVARY